MNADARQWLKQTDDRVDKTINQLRDASGWLEQPGPKEFADIKTELDEAIADLEFVQGMINTLGSDLDNQAQEQGP